MELTGRVLHGLDEFMLRLGHLTLLIETAKSKGGSARKFEKALTAVLTKSVEIPGNMADPMLRYLRNSKHRRYRDVDSIHTPASTSTDEISPGAAIRLPPVWLQDFLIAQPGVLSHVGAVTVSSKPGSKTGVSHLVDWAVALELVTPAGRLTTIAELIAGMRRPTDEHDISTNPYQLSFERIPLGYSYIWADFDVFRTLIINLEKAETEIRKRDATKLYTDSVQCLIDQLEHSSFVNVRQSRQIRILWKDLENPSRKSRKPIWETSTAWHRASSRFETLVDLGLLTKGEEEDRKFEYKYHVTDRILRTASGIKNAGSATDWFERCFSDIFWDGTASSDLVPIDDLVNLLPGIVKLLDRPTNPLPITTVSIGLLWRLFEKDRPHTLGAIRKSLEMLVIRHPDFARLSSGARAGSSGLISLNLRNIPGSG